jgi:hypothetical protein
MMVRTGLVAASISVLIPAVALGESLDLMNCRSGTVNIMHADKELTVFSVDLKGISFTRNANKALDNSSSNCFGTVRVGAGQNASHGFCKYLDADGDAVMVEWSGVPPKGGPWSFLGGTGKWTAVQGKGEWQTLPNPKPIAPGTVQTCNIVTGEYTLRK